MMWSVLFVCFTFRKNTEKVIYFLLLDRKKRKPAKKDDEECLFSQSPGKKYILQFLDLFFRLVQVLINFVSVYLFNWVFLLVFICFNIYLAFIK